MWAIRLLKVLYLKLREWFRLSLYRRVKPISARRSPLGRDKPNSFRHVILVESPERVTPRHTESVFLVPAATSPSSSIIVYGPLHWVKLYFFLSFPLSFFRSLSLSFSFPFIFFTSSFFRLCKNEQTWSLVRGLRGKTIKWLVNTFKGPIDSM